MSGTSASSHSRWLLCSRYPPRRNALSSLVRIVLDGLVIAGSLLFVSWATVLGPMYRDSTGSWISQAIGLAYPVGDVVTISILLFVIVRSRRQGLVPAVTLFLLSGGLIFFAISDSGFAYLTSKDLYKSGGLIDGGWFLGFSLLLLAGLRPADVTPGPNESRGAGEAIGGAASVCGGGAGRVRRRRQAAHGRRARPVPRLEHGGTHSPGRPPPGALGAGEPLA